MTFMIKGRPTGGFCIANTCRGVLQYAPTTALKFLDIEKRFGERFDVLQWMLGLFITVATRPARPLGFA